MGEKLIVGPINKGLRNDRTAFVIDNDSFPTMINAYQWRGRVKRKRGTQFLCRLQRFLGTTDGSGNLTVTISPTPIKAGVVSIYVLGVSQTDTFTDPGGASPVTLLSTNASASATINRSTGVLAIATSQINSPVWYYPSLPVMGLEDLNLTSTQFPGTIAFDTTYSYNITTSSPYPSYDVSFYKNPAANASMPSYVPKSTWTPLNWNGQDYQQFWSTNYEGALWVTNGINVPFSITNIGMQFKTITNITNIVAGPPASAKLTIAGHGLVVGDFVFINEVSNAINPAPSGIFGINFQTGYVTVVNDANNVTVVFPNATLSGAYSSGGIAQYLTNTATASIDSLRWYDGDPTNGNVISPSFVQGNGWVNFSPPLSQGSFSIAELPAKQYYLVGARIILPYKDRLIFFGPVVQASSGNPIYLQDTVIYSQNGTPYYTASYTNTPSSAKDTPTSATNVFNSLLVPTNQTATSSAYFCDQVGFGGFISIGVSQPIITAAFNEDSIIIGLGKSLQVRMIYTGNDVLPFNFYVINNELSSSSTFSAITMDKGVITKGSRGYIITNQTEAQRIDLEIPDQVFEVDLLTNGNERFTSQRDFINEWIYFSYPTNDPTSTYPNQTLQFNYRDNSWAIFNESYTTYGSFLRQTGFTWATVGLSYPTWASWNDPWDAGESTLLQPQVIGGNQQGFVLVKGVGTGEGTSLDIQNISGNTITSPNHNLQSGQFIFITGCQGTVGNVINNKIFQVTVLTTSTFTISNPGFTIPSGLTYTGLGLITLIYVPFIQTKQFPASWGISRKTLIGPQQYLLTTTSNGQITLQIYLSQNSSSPYNSGSIIPFTSPPNPELVNSSLVYSQTLYTCPESTNLGLTPANINLQQVTAAQQAQTWHRVNTSLIGDTIQLGFTLSSNQVFELASTGISTTITNATQANPCVLTCSSVTSFEVNQLIQVNGVVGMTQLNGNDYSITGINTGLNQITISVNSLGFTAYSSGGTIIQVANFNNFAEIELHGFILDVSPSQVLA